MLCHYSKCREPIETGDACVPVSIDGAGHYRFYHPNCYATEKGERKDGWAVWELTSGNVAAFYEATDWRPVKGVEI